jgi:hypothetical protein
MMNSTDEKIILFCTGIINIVSFALVLCVMWHWFVVPKFPSAPEFGLFQMLGLATTARVMVSKTSHAKEIDPRTLAQKAVWDVLSAPFLLSIGWLIHLLAVRFPWQLH